MTSHHSAVLPEHLYSVVLASIRGHAKETSSSVEDALERLLASSFLMFHWPE